MSELYAVRWARRKVGLEMDYGRWHAAPADGDPQTLCGVVVMLARASGTFLPDHDDRLEIVDCQHCRRKLDKLKPQESTD